MKLSSRYLFLAALLLASTAHAQRFVPSADSAKPRILFPDSMLSWNDRCPVTREKLSVDIAPVFVNSRPVAFCCNGCVAEFTLNPARYMRRMHATLADPVNPQVPATLDSASFVRVNHEIYFLHDAESRAAFEKDPIKYTGPLTDPVSLVRFQPTPKSPHLVSHGKPFYFSGSATFSTFQAAPDSFEVRKREE